MFLDFLNVLQQPSQVAFYPFNVPAHRPHRIRLMREIAQRKLRSKSRSSSGGAGGHEKSETLEIENQVACNLRPTSATDRQEVFSRQPMPSPPEHNTPQVSPGCAKLVVDSPPAPKATCPADGRADSSSTSTACTAYSNTTPQRQLSAPPAEVQPSTAAATGRPLRTSAKETSEGGGEGSSTTDVEGSEPLRSGRKRSFEQEAKEDAACSWEGQDATKDSCEPPDDAPGGATNVAHLAVASDASNERRIKTPRLKNKLEGSDVRADSVKAGLGGRESFLRVRVCDQPQQAGMMAGKGEIGR